MTAGKQFKTLLFDVLGTLLDEDAGMIEAAGTITGPGEEARALAATWSKRHAAALDDVRAGQRPYVTSEQLHAETLEAAITAGDQPSTAAVRSWAATFGRRLDPFAEVPAAMERLARGHRLVGLTNAGIIQAFEMSGHAGLRWTTLISGETVGAYKPDPRVYGHAIKTLALTPDGCLFVAAHPWDLEAAAEHGFHTAYIDRSTSSAEAMSQYQQRFDYAEPHLVALAESLQKAQ